MSTSPIQILLDELRTWVDELTLTEQVIAAILPNGKPHQFESALWDYKEKLPILPARPTEEDQRQYRADIGDIIKDVVAFHNCYGGYIMFGVTDKGGERVHGCSVEFDCGDFNRRLVVLRHKTRRMPLLNLLTQYGHLGSVLAIATIKY